MPIKHDSDLLAMAKAWADGGSNGVAALLGVSVNKASCAVANLRRVYPKLFPRAHRVPTVRRTVLARRALQVLEGVRAALPEAAHAELENAIRILGRLNAPPAPNSPTP